jgi:tRNA (mo5U34)-methyltransferase
MNSKKLLTKTNQQFLSFYSKQTSAPLDLLAELLYQKVQTFDNPNIENFHQAYLSLPNISPTQISLDQDIIHIGQASDLKNKKTQLASSLKNLKPWRKGPYNLFGTLVKSEWNSNLKWNRIKSALPNLKNKTILDIGCSSGYYMLRMLAHKPRLLIGIDPSEVFYYQFQTIQKYLQIPNMHYLPLKLENINAFPQKFDIIFCMGILYHQRSPLEALRLIKESMHKKSALILETLIIDSPLDVALFPRTTYAKMRNTYFIPSINCLLNWLTRAGFKNNQIISTNQTSSYEQHQTSYSTSKSLTDFLDPNDKNKTIEGYPAPIRACLVSHF